MERSPVAESPQAFVAVCAAAMAFDKSTPKAGGIAGSTVCARPGAMPGPGKARPPGRAHGGFLAFRWDLLMVTNIYIYIYIYVYIYICVYIYMYAYIYYIYIIYIYIIYILSIYIYVYNYVYHCITMEFLLRS